jgi:hypothetical protein
MSLGAPWLAPQKRVVRTHKNPLDVATVVSIFPIKVEEQKPTLDPGYFIIEPGTYDKPTLLTVGSSCWWLEPDDSKLIEVPTSSVLVAESIVKDYCNGLLCAESGSPGLFWVPGKIKDVIELKMKHKKELDDANDKQFRWYKALVRMGDVLWSRSQGNPLAISDLMRIAAQETGDKNKPWMADFSTVTLNNCPACGALRNNDYPICQVCRTVVDPDKFKGLGLQQLTT